MNYTDDPKLALVLAEKILTGEVVVYYDPSDGEIHLTTKRVVENRPWLMEGMQGATLEEYAQAAHWADEIVPNAKLALNRNRR